MDPSQEKHPQHSAADPESPVSPIYDPSNPPDANAQSTWASMPRRKPLPAPVAATDAEAAHKEIGTESKPKGFGASLGALLSFNWYRYGSKSQKRKFLIIGAVIVVALLALIIGLAVGLTVNKK